jgi:hypothetical protein
MMAALIDAAVSPSKPAAEHQSDGSDNPDGRQKNSRAAMVFGKT